MVIEAVRKPELNQSTSSVPTLSAELQCGKTAELRIDFPSRVKRK
jgi:hypothetical protein